MKVKSKLFHSALIAATVIILVVWLALPEKSENLFCGSDIRYQNYSFASKRGNVQNITFHLSKTNKAKKGKGRISFTSNIDDNGKKYYLRRDIIVEYQVADSELYFFKTLSINKDVRDNITEHATTQTMANTFYEVDSLSSYTIRSVGQQGYLVYQADTPIFFCNRV